MPDPFTLSFIVISFALHIGHIGYTIYKDTPTTIIKEENVKEEEEEEEEEDVVKKPTQYDAEFQNTVKIIKSFEIPQLITDAHDESSILKCRHVKIRTH
jgi:hypothetical protein